ncbi:MAG: DUF456 domain-containing protein [Anaerolineae bacterium]|nr:DUF456 domain-containing protein [Anaerolineae bacterium]
MLPWAYTTLRIIVLVLLILTWFGTVIPVFPAPTVMWVLILVHGIVTGFGTRGAILFGFITLLTIISLFTDNFFSIKGARQGGARWASVAIASGVGLIASLLLTPIGGILLTVAALFAAEMAYQHNAEKAWNATKNWLLGWGWATVARLGIGLVTILLWVVWVWL